MHWFRGCELQPSGQLPVLVPPVSLEHAAPAPMHTHAHTHAHPLPHHGSRAEPAWQWLQGPGAGNTYSVSGPQEKAHRPQHGSQQVTQPHPTLKQESVRLLWSRKTELEPLWGQHWRPPEWLTPGHQQGSVSEMAASFLQEQAQIWMGTNTVELISPEHYFIGWHPCSGNLTGSLIYKIPTPVPDTQDFLVYTHTHTHTHTQSLSHVWFFETLWTVDFSGKNARVGSHFLLQEIFPT